VKMSHAEFNSLSPGNCRASVADTAHYLHRGDANALSTGQITSASEGPHYGQPGEKTIHHALVKERRK